MSDSVAARADAAPDGPAAYLDRACRGLTRMADPNRAAMWLVASASALALLGLFVQFTVVPPGTKAPLEVPIKQTVFVVLGLFVGAVVARIGFRVGCRLSRPAIWLTWAPLAWLALRSGDGQAARWLEISSLKVQPSEFAKVTLILFFAAYAARLGEKMASFRDGFLPAMGYLGLTAVLVVMAPDLGQTLFIVASSGAVLLVGGMRAAHLVPTAIVGGGAALGAMCLQWEYVQRRFTDFAAGGGFQVKQGLFFLERGGVAGVGLEQARAYTSVPEIHNDFALVAIGEVVGFLGTASVCLLFLAICWNGLSIAFAARDRLGFLVAFGITFMLGMQAIVNLAVVTGSVPPKGMSLPFVSYGGSSMVVCAAAIGLLVSVARDAAAAPSAGAGTAGAQGALETNS